MSWSHPAEALWVLRFWEMLYGGLESCLRHQSACLASIGTLVWVPELTFIQAGHGVHTCNPRCVEAEMVAPRDSLPANLAHLENSVLMRNFASYKGRQHLREDTWGCWSPCTHVDMCKWSHTDMCGHTPRILTHTNGVKYHFFCLSWNTWTDCHAATAHLHSPPLLLSPP